MKSVMNTQYRKNLPGTPLDYFDTREAVDAIQPGAYAKLPYTSRVLAEQLVRRCDPVSLTDSLKQLIERKQDLDFPWYPARVVCHDILGQTALVDLAGLRDAIATLGADFWRLRIGIGHPGSRERVSPHVLSRPSLDDRIRIDRCIDEALRALPEAVKGNWPIAMNTNRLAFHRDNRAINT